MPSLHDTTELTKNILKWGGIGITAIIILVFLVRGSIVVYKSVFPDVPPPPETAFGALPPLSFPKSKTDQKFTYVIDTVSGKLPSYPDRIKVFETVEPEPNLLNLRDTREKLATVDFELAETKITDTVYSWIDRTVTNKRITYNIVSNDFTISSNYLADPIVTSSQGAPSSNQALGEISTFLKALNLYPLDFDPDLTTTQYLTLQNNELFPATSISNGQITRIDLFQKDLDEIPIRYPLPPFSIFYFLLANRGPSTTLLEGQFSHQEISDISSTYPIKSIQEAYEELEDGKAYIANYYGTSSEIAIKNAYLAYYVTNEKQKYIQPIYVFEGKNGFYAYVQAIKQSQTSE